MNNLNDTAYDLISSNQFSETIQLFQKSLRIDKDQWNVFDKEKEPWKSTCKRIVL